MTNFIKKYAGKIITMALTIAATGVANQGCFYFLNQSEEPEGLKRFSTNK